MLLLLVGLAFALPILWTISVGAIREARRAREVDPREGCQAWVAVRGVGGRLYRCAQPVFIEGGSRCLRHRQAERDPASVDPDADLIDQPQAVGRATALARIGVPLAVLVATALVGTAVWALTRMF
ncbi:MAG: hypothetical protein WEB03_11745 [Nitriliruptor sp.]|uniref:hypothetical protein n=1 Tax=Nitriliruptor sp. TaxID=2448056 RepID=UPI0034A0013F